ncbi:hypothetical protein [Bombilactobacillus thymidiniphilus]|uniref:Phage protein n=1 Tax=Bombilactobacillus thymidiniphilus TaxID=2923363 RepID=A0ABY4PEZ6_9LACO|nr:hypothetical protein [Bombilactobacillus thymidiniphilus]UQS83877.1 hypothetical protein MOO47_01415 [Bombilactobacillus thymidiniphilus]
MNNYQILDLIEQITRNDNTKYYELANIFMNGRAELAAERGMIKEVAIVQLNIPHSTAVQTYEKYINDTYEFPAEDFDHWQEWDKPAGKIKTAFEQVLQANHIG